jgi:predicted Fe-S protein YdhL (DUF1289 family)
VRQFRDCVNRRAIYVLQDMIQTPCINICTIDARSRLCMGCGRTLDEVAGWSRFTPERRAAVMAELPARMADAGLSKPGLAKPGLAESGLAAPAKTPG